MRSSRDDLIVDRASLNHDLQQSSSIHRMVTQVGLNKYLQQLLPLTSGKPLARALLLAFLCRSHMFWVYPWEQEGASLAARGATPPLRRTGLRAVSSLPCHVRQSSISTRLTHVVTRAPQAIRRTTRAPARRATESLSSSALPSAPTAATNGRAPPRTEGRAPRRSRASRRGQCCRGRRRWRRGRGLSRRGRARATSSRRRLTPQRCRST